MHALSLQSRLGLSGVGGLISDVEFAVMENGDVQVRSALRSMAPDACLDMVRSSAWRSEQMKLVG